MKVIETPEPDRTIPIPIPFRPNQNFSENNVPLIPSSPVFYLSNPSFRFHYGQCELVTAVPQLSQPAVMIHNILCQGFS